ncbi:MAG: hypothetical protein MK060_19415 [Blastomonas sp.]|uniref:hypothetical protein n=1 Tax=Blastomonas sp. TaxID=1909299 RepID=UPI003BBBA78F|nr:hypothetical protein [Blastomonas sp.]
MNERDPDQTFAGELPTNFAEHQLAHDAAEADRRYMLQRRDQFSERLLFGAMALNGASIVALLGVLASADASAALGFNSAISIWSAASFIVGMVLAGYAANEREIVYIEEAGDAGAWAQAHAVLSAFRDQAFIDEYRKRYSSALKRIGKLQAVGYQWSPASTKAHYRAGGAWLMGITAPLLNNVLTSLAPISSWWPF